MGLLIQGGTVVTSEREFRADVFADDSGVIRRIGDGLKAESASDRVVDATGRYVLPGMVDPHTHMALPFMGTVSADDFEQGTIAALVGGTTTIVDFTIPKKGQSMIEALEEWNAKAQGKCASDYAFHMAVVDWNERVAREVGECMRRGISSFKTFTAYKGALMLEDGPLFDFMLLAREIGALVTIHAVNGDVLNVLAERFVREGKTAPAYHPRCQPPEIEGEATHRAIALARLAGVPLYVVHVTCRDALEEIARANARGQEVYCETCVQYLLLDESLYELPDFEGAKYVLSPPLRKREDREALWGGLARGQVHAVGTDHCPFLFASQKSMGREDFRKIPNGFAGVEERLSLLYTYGVCEGRITLPRLVAVAATEPARIFGLKNKGAIAIGADADIVIYDPAFEGTFSAKTQKSRCDYSCYEGWKRKGRPSHVFVRGRLVVEQGEFCGERGFGRFIPRPGRFG